MQKSLLLLLIVSASCLFSCTSLKVEMDNPTDETITVKIDSVGEYTLAPKELIEIKGLKKGNYRMQVGVEPERSFTLKRNSLLNPTSSLYVVMEEEYSVGGRAAIDESKYKTVTIDGEEYRGRIRVYRDTVVINTRNVTFGVLVPFRNEIRTGKKSPVVLSKIFRKEDFIKYYEETYL